MPAAIAGATHHTTAFAGLGAAVTARPNAVAATRETILFFMIMLKPPRFYPHLENANVRSSGSGVDRSARALAMRRQCEGDLLAVEPFRRVMRPAVPLRSRLGRHGLLLWL